MPQGICERLSGWGVERMLPLQASHGARAVKAISREPTILYYRNVIVLFGSCAARKPLTAGKHDAFEHGA